jgi:hypothetical protein
MNPPVRGTCSLPDDLMRYTVRKIIRVNSRPNQYVTVILLGPRSYQFNNLLDLLLRGDMRGINFNRSLRLDQR